MFSRMTGFYLGFRPVQVFRHTLGPGTSLNSSGQVRTYSRQVPLLPPPPQEKRNKQKKKNLIFNATFQLFKYPWSQD